MQTAIWTIGHSTRPLEAFIDLLRAHHVQRIADVRAFPYSRRHPHFNGTALQESLGQVDIQYTHFPLLGGRRKSNPDSINLGWRNQSFRGYADYMQTPLFQGALMHLMSVSGKNPTAILCAEAVPWRCHRFLIADALVTKGWNVWHILQATKATPHVLAPMARIKDDALYYPIGSDLSLF